MPQNNELIEAKNALSENLLRGEFPLQNTISVTAAAESARSNVHAVGVGRKIVEGKVTDEKCVRIYVLRKLPRSVLSENAVLPSEFAGIPTDIIESPPAFITGRKKPHGSQDAVNDEPQLADESSCTVDRKRRQRPVIGGISSGHFTITAGTLGYFCRSVRSGDNPNEIYALSNNHVYADVNRGMPGDALLQPGPADGGTNADRFAELSRFVRIRLGGTDTNLVDAAIGRILPENFSTPQICSIGRIDGVGDAVENMRVRKHGRTSGYTEGNITDESYDALVGMDHGDPSVVAKFVNQMRIEVTPPFTAFGLGGDSGSLVVGPGNRAIGLYFAGPSGGTYGIANHIGNVLSELEIDLL